MKLRLLALACAMLGAAGPANAEQMEWVRQAYDRLQSQFGYYDQTGQIPLGSFAYQIAPGSYWEMNISPQSTGRIFAAAACDDDCTGMDFAVSDDRGFTVYDYWDGTGRIYFQAETGRTYTIRFTPQECSASFCFTLGTVYQRVQ